MDTQHLKAFITVARLESFTEAAEQLHLTQPAISKRISALEQQLNCRLFDRIGRGISLTEAGEALLPKAEKILQDVSDTELALSNLSGNVGGTLKLATSHHIGLHHLPQLLKLYTREYPEVTLDLDFMDSEKAYAAINRGEVELAIITLSEHQPVNMAAIPLWEDPLAFVVAADHPLATVETPDLSQLSHLPAILPDTSTQTTQLVAQLFDNNRCGLMLSMTTNYLETIKMMVSIGLGWSALPETMVDDQLKKIVLPGITLTRDLGCIHHRERTLSNAARAFIQALQS
ncbi:LysR family transcriptional regulator [Aestuariicella hydrocarbonica]|uniref:LysR family transcriptional regulator n=1 Tax=Pseudomaricurvus hydrocarbonicus TaxID=1470433 RepID=A0A9E5JSA5_9GAMM|nr:LysR family transcriptional regulator [Aestuariicella hydrocarbonica]NHO64399.1 LysR family transcriptional regulator [Aestuariicella hydrocarbonica]